MTGFGFPKSREQFSTFRDVTSNTPASGKTQPVDLVGKAIPDIALFSDAFIQMISDEGKGGLTPSWKNIPYNLECFSETRIVDRPLLLNALTGG